MINKLESIKKGLILEDNVYCVIPFDDYNSHYLGINNDYQIALLIKSINIDKKRYVNFKGRNLKILFDRESAINNQGVNENDRFTILHLMSDKRNIQNYFLDICELLLKNIGDYPKIENVHKELENVKEIFLNLNKNKLKQELGLWGELFLISLQNNKEKAISSWHLNSKDRLDFNSGKIKVEVKTTLSNERKHIFKLNQLRNHYKENVLVCSIMTAEIENGISIINLIDVISKNIKPVVKLKLLNKISSVLGNELLTMNFRCFDKRSALESILIYDSKEIPAIDQDCFSDQISNIVFTSNLTKSLSKNVDIKKLIF